MSRVPSVFIPAEEPVSIYPGNFVFPTCGTAELADSSRVQFKLYPPRFSSPSSSPTCFKFSLSLSNDIFLHSNILVATFEKKNRGEITIDRPRERREDEKLVGGGELISKRAIVVETCRVTKHRTF